MKIVITSKKNSIDSEMDLRFGRAAWLAVLNTEDGSVEFVENDGASAQSGAGPKVAEKVANLGAAKVFSGDFGPKAKAALQSMGIEMVVLRDEPVLKELINQIK
jgi:predicted Fe-Mo cluster-binding NifX family protein